MSIPAENYEKYLVQAILSAKAKEAFDMMVKLKNWETDEDLDQYIYYRGKYDALAEVLSDFMER